MSLPARKRIFLVGSSSERRSLHEAGWSAGAASLSRLKGSLPAFPSAHGRQRTMQRVILALVLVLVVALVVGGLFFWRVP